MTTATPAPVWDIKELRFSPLGVRVFWMLKSEKDEAIPPHIVAGVKRHWRSF